MSVILGADLHARADARAERDLDELVLEAVARSGPLDGRALLLELHGVSPSAVVRRSVELVFSGRLRLDDQRRFVLAVTP